MRRALPLLVVVACGPAAEPAQAPRGAPPSGGPPGRAVETNPLEAFCGGSATQRCPTLTEHLAELRAKDCPEVATSHNTYVTRPCGAFTRVDTDYGIVGYSRWFDGAGKLVAAAAHVYEHRTEAIYGPVPSCAAAAGSPVCEASSP